MLLMVDDIGSVLLESCGSFRINSYSERIQQSAVVEGLVATRILIILSRLHQPTRSQTP